MSPFLRKTQPVRGDEITDNTHLRLQRPRLARQSDKARRSRYTNASAAGSPASPVSPSVRLQSPWSRQVRRQRHQVRQVRLPIPPRIRPSRRRPDPPPCTATASHALLGAVLVHDPHDSSRKSSNWPSASSSSPTQRGGWPLPARPLRRRYRPSPSGQIMASAPRAMRRSRSKKDVIDNSVEYVKKCHKNQERKKREPRRRLQLTSPTGLRFRLRAQRRSVAPSTTPESLRRTISRTA